MKPTTAMERLAPTHVPVYETSEQRQQLWQRCADRDQPVIAVRNATRGYIVRYDLQHLEVELDEPTVRALRSRTKAWRPYPTGTDPISESEGVGGEAGAISGELHTHSESEARQLAAHLSELVFEQANWVGLHADCA